MSEDIRSKKIIFVSNCILNANNKVEGFARYKSAFKEILDLFESYDLGIMQMPCPEVLYMGCRRWWQDRNIYNNASYKKHCHILSEQIVDYMENYMLVGYKVVGIIFCDGSPSCGLNSSSFYKNAGGRPAEPIRILINEPGIFAEELIKSIESRGLPIISMHGVAMDDLDKTNEEIIKDIDVFLKREIRESD